MLISEEVFLYRNRDRKTQAARSRLRLLVVGVGALGCPAAWTLVEAGVGRVTLVDPDVVELSNLQRQVLFAEEDLGRPKAQVAAARLATVGSPTEIVALCHRVDPGNASALVAEHDFVIDATDDRATKLLLNRAAVGERRRLCYAAVARASGQLMGIEPGRSACLECVFPPAPGESSVPSGCDELGIVAPVAGTIGSLAALLALAAAEGAAAWRPGSMIFFELGRRRWRSIAFPRRRECPCCGGAGRQHDERTRRQESCPSSRV
ncbi:MAG: HesA/MoeB/ThiF family protein [Candidatus Dadabacteria bacterium]|nr:MAG: HesA/MoeB/ThiF family protein [Candidatus Dadabacteria bacterium]